MNEATENIMMPIFCDQNYQFLTFEIQSKEYFSNTYDTYDEYFDNCYN